MVLLIKSQGARCTSISLRECQLRSLDHVDVRHRLGGMVSLQPKLVPVEFRWKHNFDVLTYAKETYPLLCFQFCSVEWADYLIAVTTLEQYLTSTVPK
jgi:hypothetical protein